MSKFCKNCGAQLKPDSKFCASCGTVVTVPSVQETVLFSTGSGNKPAAKKRNMPPKKILIPVIAAVLVVAVGIGLLPRFWGGGSYPFKKGATVETTVRAGKDTKIGNSAKTGWELLIPDGVMEDGTAVTMKVLSQDEAKNYQSSGFTLYGTPIEVSGDGAHGVWFAAPVPVTIKIPKEYLKDLAAEELFFATYEDSAWRFFLADNVNLKDGTATFKSSHFSWLGFGKPSEEDQIKTFAQTYAASEYDRVLKKEKFHKAVGTQLDDLFKSMGVDSASARKQLVKDAVTYLESAAYDELLEKDNPVKAFAPADTLMRLADAVQKGGEGKQEANDKVIELYTKAVAFGIEKHINANKTFYGVKDAQTGYVDTASKAITVLGGLGTAAGAFAGGDRKAGFEAIGNLLTSLAGPKAQLIVSTLNYAKAGLENAADAAQTYWTKSEIEEAYRLYTMPGGDFEGDFDGIFALKGNAEALMNIRIIKAHCAKYGIKEDDLGSAAREAAIKNAWKGLRGYFEQRKAAEPQIAKLRQDEEAFIAVLKKQGLLSSTYSRDYFGIDTRGSNYSVSERLRRLYAIRDAVLNCIDADQRDGIGNERLVRAIDQWIYWNGQKDRAGFFKYLRETGLYEESFTSESAYAWVLVETRTNEEDMNDRLALTNSKNPHTTKEVSASSGSAVFTTTYIGPDQTKTLGYHLFPGNTAIGEITWTPPKASYGPEDAVILHLTVKNTARDSKYPLNNNWLVLAQHFLLDEKGGQSGYAAYFPDGDGETSFTCGPGNAWQSYDVTVSAKLGTGSKTGVRKAVRVSASDGVSVETYYIYEWKEAD